MRRGQGRDRARRQAATRRSCRSCRRWSTPTPCTKAFAASSTLALYRAGRQVEALDAYQVARRTLDEQLGLEPSRDLRDLERAILEQDIALAPPPAGRGPAPRPTLPAAVSSFVGRRREVADVQQLLSRDGVRLVTLTGPGGIGKTRLALAVAGPLEASFAYGVFLVELAPLRDAQDVPAAIAAVLGVRESAAGTLPADLARVLAPQETLLVLDNLEHLPEAARLVRALLGAAPRLRVLTTSREPLRLRGEYEYALARLALDGEGELSPAVELFRDRARAALASFQLTPQTLDAVKEICRQLDGLPLAIELAAARVKLLPPRALLGNLDAWLSLEARETDRPERHRTLRAAIEWSFELLGPTERLVFARLSVFRGGFRLDDAEGVCGAGIAGPALVDVVASLLDKNLLTHSSGNDDAPRLGMCGDDPRLRWRERAGGGGGRGAASAARTPRPGVERVGEDRARVGAPSRGARPARGRTGQHPLGAALGRRQRPGDRHPDPRRG